MYKKSIAALAASVAITLGVGASSYAWFTSTASSTNNSFKTGILSILASTFGNNWSDIANAQADVNNMEPGDSKVLTYTFTNTNAAGKISTLPLTYKSTVTGSGALLNVATFDVSLNGTSLGTGLSYTAFQTLMATERRVDPAVSSDNKTYTAVTQSYAIKATLPGEATNNDYQDAAGSFNIVTDAKQVNGNYASAPTSTPASTTTSTTSGQ